MASFEDIPKPKSRKAKSSPFLVFMMQFKKKEERNGNFMTMEEAQIEAGKVWETFRYDQREKYDVTAKESTCDRVQYTSNGISIDEIDRIKKEAQKQQRVMELTIEEMLLTAYEKKQLKLLEFVFFSASYFVKTLDGDIYPAEIAMTKFSLGDGVTNSFNILVDPGELPMGMAAVAKDHAEHPHSGHRIPIPPHNNSDFESDYGFLFNKIMNFLVGPDGDRNIPPIFTESGPKNIDINVAKKTLDKIVAMGGDGRNISFRVYPIEHLLFRMHKKCIADRNAINGTAEIPFTSVPMAEEMLARDEFRYSDLGCKFHCQLDNSANCSLSKVKRWGYRISRYCLDAERDRLIPGRHLPEKMLVLGQSDIQSLSSKDSWDSDLTNSFREIRIDSSVTASHSPAPSKADSDAPDTVSIASVEMTNEAASITDGGSTLDNVKYTKPSYSQLLRRGRGGRSTSTSFSSSASQK